MAVDADDLTGAGVGGVQPGGWVVHDVVLDVRGGAPLADETGTRFADRGVRGRATSPTAAG